MSLRNIYILLVVVFLNIPSLFSQSGYIGKPIIHYFGTEAYKAGTQNWELIQDRRGVLYSANNQGLLEFDGEQWRLHKMPKTNTLKSVAVDAQGRIYVGGQKQFGYFMANDKGVLSYTSLDAIIPKDTAVDFDEIWDIYCTKNAVYFCSHKAIFIYQNNSLKVVQHPYEIRYAYWVDNTLFVSGWDEGLLQLKNQQLVPVVGGEIFRHKIIRAITPHQKGKYLVCTLDGSIYSYDKDSFQPWASELWKTFQKSFVNVAVQLSNGNIAIGTQNHGLFMLSQHGELLVHLDKNTLWNQTVFGLYQDQFDNLWVGLNNGIVYFKHNSPFTIVDGQVNVFGGGYSVLEDNRKLYLGTSNGLFLNETSTNYQEQKFKLIPGTTGQVYEIAMLDQKVLLGHHAGAFQIEEDKATQFSDVTGAWLFQKLKKAPEYMLQGHYTGFLLYKKQGTRWVFVRKNAGFEESARLFAQEDDGTIWISHGFKGVYKVRLSDDLTTMENVKFYGEKEGFPSNILINLFEVHGRIVFCAESGVYRYDRTKDQFIEDEEFNAFFDVDERVAELEEDQFGNLYFIEGGRLGVLKKDRYDGFVKETKLFNQINHLLSDDLENITAVNQSSVFFGAKEGFVHYNPSLQSVSQEKELPIVIRNIESGSDSVCLEFGGNSMIDKKIDATLPEYYTLTLPYSQNSLSIDFASPFYDGLEQVEYQYILKGFDKNWSSWGERSSVHYTNLSEGSYYFKVKAKNVYDKESKVEMFRVIILPPWYRSTTSYIVYALLFCWAIGMIVAFLNKKHQSERKIMVEKIEERESQIVNISQKSEAQIEQLKQEKLQVELEHKNQELMLTTMHIVNKNEFLIDIKKKLQTMLKQIDNTTLAKEVRKMSTSIDKNIADEREWQQFEEHFDLVHGDFFKKLREKYSSLSIQEAKLCGYLKMEMTTKEMAQLLNLSVRGVETCRYRLRKKFELETEMSLIDFLKQF